MINTLRNVIESLPKRTLLLGILVLVLAGLVIGSMAILRVSPVNPTTDPVIIFSPEPSSTPSTNQNQALLTSMQKSLIGKTTDQDIAKMGNLLEKQSGTDNSVTYKFQSFIPQRTNEVVTRQGRAVFERIITPVNPVGQGFTKISAFQQAHGQPLIQIRGSLFYGPFFETYIYSNQGFAFIGNPYTDTIYEIQIFSRTAPDNYIRLYGQDVNPDAKIDESL